MSFGDFIAEQRRLLILQALNSAASGERLALPVLHRYLLAIELRPTAQQVDNDLLMLQGVGLVDRTETGGVVLALITQAGRDVAAGRARAAGVADTVVR